MKQIPWGKNEKDAMFCEMKCMGFEHHTGRCVGWVFFGDKYPRHPERKYCLPNEEAWEICPKNTEEK